MYLFEVILIGLGLSMDAVSVSMTNGMVYRTKLCWALIIAFFFGLFQGIMPILGFLAGSVFTKQISAFDHWIALILLLIIGGKMLYDSIKGDEDESNGSKKLTLRLLLVQAIATSIDALAVGVSFAAMRVNLIQSASIIALTTFILSFLAVLLGKKIGTKLNRKAGIFGGTVLVLTGIKIFVEHMFFA